MAKNDQPATPTGADEATGKPIPIPQTDLGTSKNPTTISWTASEFVAHEKSSGWYGLLGLATLVLAAFVYLISRDAVSVAVVIVGAIFLGIYAASKPRQLEYKLDHQGLNIDTKHWSYSEFRSFSVVPEKAFSSIIFMPLKRFAVPITIYYAPEDEDKILNLLAERLPFEQPPRDAVDSLMRRIRF